MTWTRSVLTVAMLWAVSGGLFAAQEPAVRSSDGDPAAIRPDGMFRALRDAWHRAHVPAGPNHQVWSRGARRWSLQAVKGGGKVPRCRQPAHHRRRSLQIWSPAYVAAQGPNELRAE